MASADGKKKRKKERKRCRCCHALTFLYTFFLCQRRHRGAIDMESDTKYQTSSNSFRDLFFPSLLFAQRERILVSAHLSTTVGTLSPSLCRRYSANTAARIHFATVLSPTKENKDEKGRKKYKNKENEGCIENDRYSRPTIKCPAHELGCEMNEL